MGGVKKERMFEELLEIQEMLEKRTETQGQMIKKFQMLIANEGLYSKVIDLFPYPIAIYTPQYKLILTNKAFTSLIEEQSIDMEKKTTRILRHKINDIQLASAVKEVFDGRTYFLENLDSPFSMFSEIIKEDAVKSDHFNKVVIFPLTTDDSKISHGVIFFMP